MDFPPRIKKFQLPESALYDFVRTVPNGAHVKDAKTGKYIFANKACSNIFAVDEPKDIVGLTTHDLDKFMRPYWGAGYAKEISNMDYRVKGLAEPIFHSDDIFINGYNYVYIQDIFKLPLVGASNKVTAVLTLLTERTKQINFFALLNLYKKMYRDKSSGLLQFMKYLELDAFFYGELTEKEILCLLNMKSNQSYKSIAEILQISLKTVETHISHIIAKLKSGNLALVLAYLRDWREEK
jgi:DNA-binding CsgD family transcriptional regulator